MAVLENLDNEMRCGIFTNSKGEVLIVHDQETQSPIQWIEFIPETKALTLVHEEGQIQNLGISVDDKMEANLLQAQEVVLAHLINKQIKSTQSVTLVIQDHF